MSTNLKKKYEDTQMKEYQKSITVDPKIRAAYISEYGEVELPTESLHFDDILKENNLLRYAMEYPNQYVEKRNKLLNEIKKDVDTEFVTTYKKFSEGEQQLPASEAKFIAMTAAEDLMHSRINQLEKVYPGRFENKAYIKILENYKANKIKNFSSFIEPSSEL